MVTTLDHPKKAEMITNGNVNLKTLNIPKIDSDSLHKILDNSRQPPLVRVKGADMALERVWEVNDLLSRWVDLNYIDFNINWNPLMCDVVAKIELTHQVCIIDNECTITTTGYEMRDIVTVTAETKHQAVWIACYEFVRLKNSGAFIESRK